MYCHHHITTFSRENFAEICENKKCEISSKKKKITVSRFKHHL